MIGANECVRDRRHAEIDRHRTSMMLRRPADRRVGSHAAYAHVARVREHPTAIAFEQHFCRPKVSTVPGTRDRVGAQRWHLCEGSRAVASSRRFVALDRSIAAGSRTKKPPLIRLSHCGFFNEDSHPTVSPAHRNDPAVVRRTVGQLPV